MADFANATCHHAQRLLPPEVRGGKKEHREWPRDSALIENDFEYARFCRHREPPTQRNAARPHVPTERALNWRSSSTRGRVW